MQLTNKIRISVNLVDNIFLIRYFSENLRERQL